jgi:hypothetical protein
MNTARFIEDMRFQHMATIKISATKDEMDAITNQMIDFLSENENIEGNWSFEVDNDWPVSLVFSFTDLNSATMFKLKF